MKPGTVYAAAVWLLVWMLGATGHPAGAAETADEALARGFAEAVRPFVEKHCLACHDEKKQEAKLDLSGYASTADVARDYRVWDLVRERLEAEEMPPDDAPRQPSPHERRAVIEWIGQLRANEARRHAGDPGPVLARRLSNAEFDYTIADLTGVEIRPTREFPVDPANEAGFDNSGESLAMSPALLKKYLAAARLVADHLVLKPEGFVFAPHVAVTETDRDKYCVLRIVDFYERHRVDYADYFLAAWRFEDRAALGRPEATLADFAKEARLSAKYLATLWEALSAAEPATGPLGEVQTQWRKLPSDVAQAADARKQCAALRDLVVERRKPFEPKVEKIHVNGISDGSQAFVLWRNRRLASLRMSYTGEGDGEGGGGDARDLERFCRIFPAAFFVSGRNSSLYPDAAAHERLLTAGFHLMQGFFRDDQPLCELVLDDDERRELDELWRELNFVTLVPMRQYKDYIFFERAEPPRFMQGAEFDFARSEDKDATSQAKMDKLREAYLARARQIGAGDVTLEAIEEYYKNISAQIRQVEHERLAAEPSHLAALEKFAERAYRRPLASDEREELLAFYRRVRTEDGLGHEEALRDALASVLVSPYFCYRFETAESGETARPLSDYALASRLSYFLWSSMPDDELLVHAAAGEVHQPHVLVAQTRRMLGDDRVRRLAVEFGGNWLDFRRFEEHNSVDRERFTGFTNELRQAMYEEPIRFFVDVVQSDRSVLEFLDAGHTFVNPVLAKHYGIPLADERADAWVRIDDARRYGRGGLLPMSVFLTKNAPGLRTSPVKRGYWVVRRLLGERIPPPPPEVPELPKDEAKLGELTLAQLLARHREHQACAGCHERFDSVGLVFEGYGPIGERRDRDLGGKPVTTQATFPDGSQGDGLDGLLHYLTEKRQNEFLDNLCRKLLVYALGRSLLLSDEPLVENMRKRLAADGYRFGSLVESIVTSPQFLNKRGGDDARPTQGFRVQGSEQSRDEILNPEC